MSEITTSDTAPHAQAFQAIIPGHSQQVAIGASSVQSSAFQSKTSIVRLFSSSDCYIKLGTNPVATTSDMFLPAGALEYFGIDQSTKLAVIQSSSVGTLYITEGA